MSYKYSPIKKIFIRNFRCLGEVSLSFENSPIMCFIGENEAGKTSAVKAITVLGLNAWIREQMGYIRKGTEEFDVGVELVDGTCIARIKTKGKYNIYKINYPDGTSWETDKISEGLPVQVQDIMGMIEEEETGELLHTRTYENQLMFVTTPLSANYKVMYNALKVKNLTGAIKIGSLESNELKQSINNNEYLIQSQSTTLKNIKVVDTEPLTEVKNTINRLTDSIDKIVRAIEIKKRLAELQHRLGVSKLISDFKLEEIDVKVATDLMRIGRTIETIRNARAEKDRLSRVDSLPLIDLRVYERVKRAYQDNIRLTEMARERDRISEIENIKLIDITPVEHLEKAIRAKDKLMSLSDEAKRIDTSSCEEVNIQGVMKIKSLIDAISRRNQLVADDKQLRVSISKHEEALRNSGARIATCPNCGTDVIIMED